MRLTLSTLRGPSSAAIETRNFDGGEISLGRGPDNDWVLADPDRHLSKRHCTLALRSGEWHVADQSTNGTFLNSESDALALVGPRRLSDGDRLRLGEYELEVRLSAGRVTTAWADPFAPQRNDRGPVPSLFDDEPFAPIANLSGGQLGEQLIGQSGEPAIRLPSDFDPMAPRETSHWGGPAQVDNAPATSDAFRPPIIRGPSLPDDWADDLLPVSPPRPHEPAQPGPTAFTPPTLDPHSEPPAPAPVLPVAEPGLLEAFLRGAGMQNTPVPDPAALMEQMGMTMRALVDGLRQALIARSAVKSEFRIERTMISASGNNPLKFSADDDDALAALLGKRGSGMAAPAAVADALKDMRLHELATIAALQTAVRDLVAQLDPAPLKQQAGGGGLKAMRKARAWDAFEAKHASVTEGLADDFDSVFGKSFARAYERAHDEIEGRENRTP